MINLLIEELFFNPLKSIVVLHEGSISPSNGTLSGPPIFARHINGRL